jgi:excinuclease UvrABC helicase subunit UvrB
MRIDLMSRMNLESGSVVIMPMENFQKLIKRLTNKEYDEIQILKNVIDDGGDVVNIDPYQEVSIGKMFTLDKDGGNSTIIRIGPTINNSIRVLNRGEKTAEEYCMEKKNEFVNLENMGEFFIKQIENYKREMLSGE